MSDTGSSDGRSGDAGSSGAGRALSIRPAGPADAALILTLIGELAQYERMRDVMKATRDDIAELLFAPAPRAFCDIAEIGGEAVGYALWFYNVSTFEGRCGIHLEDIYVRAPVRGSGVGVALMRRLARRCREEGLTRLEWAVLDWNAPSIAFYDRLGASAQTDWITRRLSGEALERLAGE